jgi:hypothetical protein
LAVATKRDRNGFERSTLIARVGTKRGVSIVNAAVQSAHQAYRNAAELAPDRKVVRVDFGRRAELAETPNPMNRLLEWSNRELEIPTRHLIAGGGACFFLIAGAVCGAWMAG